MTGGDIRILSEPTDRNPFAVIYKPRGLPSAPLSFGEDSALTRAARARPFLLEPRGRKPLEGGLVHRIDNDTEGLLLAAATQEACDALIRFQSEGRFKKSYSAVCRKISVSPGPGFPEFPHEAQEALSQCMKKCNDFDEIAENPFSEGRRGAEMRSMFRSYSERGSLVRPVTELSGAAASRKASPVEYSTFARVRRLPGEGLFLARCVISRGFRHQVRCHLAWASLPILGDRLYDPLFSVGDEFRFRADGLSFPHPLTGEQEEFFLPEGMSSNSA